jgi:dTDP-4-dehydrorhamnose 3,5-epimerase
MELITLSPAHEDQRGKIIDLISNDQINAVTLITFIKNSVRANHFHKKTIQWNYVISGEILFVTQMPNGLKQEKILKAGDFAITREYEGHALKALLDSEVLILTKGPRAGELYETDTFRLSDPLI